MIGLPDAPDLPGFDDDTPPLRVLGEDGTLHYSDLKRMALSGRQYLYGVNTPIATTSAMLLGTAVHSIVLGPRHGAKPLVVFPGKTRRGKEWDAWRAAHPDSEILTASEWDRAQEIADALQADPVARARLDGARLEVPIEWEENGIRCSTSGIDIVRATAIGDLKTTASVHPDTWKRHAEKLLYPMQLAFYRRGARANGLDVSEGLFLLGVETKPPFEVVDLKLTRKMIDLAERAVCLWLERLRGLILSCPEPRTLSDWPGYAQTSVEWDVSEWADDEGYEDDEDEEGDKEEAA